MTRQERQTRTRTTNLPEANYLEKGKSSPTFPFLDIKAADFKLLD